MNILYVMFSHFVTQKEENMTYKGVVSGSREGQMGRGLHLHGARTGSESDIADMLARQATPALLDRGTERLFEVAEYTVGSHIN